MLALAYEYVMQQCIGECVIMCMCVDNSSTITLNSCLLMLVWWQLNTPTLKESSDWHLSLVTDWSDVYICWGSCSCCCWFVIDDGVHMFSRCWHHSAMTNCLSLHFAIYSRLNFLPEHTTHTLARSWLLLTVRVGEHNFNCYCYYYYYEGRHKVRLARARHTSWRPWCVTKYALPVQGILCDFLGASQSTPRTARKRRESWQWKLFTGAKNLCPGLVQCQGNPTNAPPPTLEHWLDYAGTVQARMEIFGTTQQLPLSTLTAFPVHRGVATGVYRYTYPKISLP